MMQLLAQFFDSVSSGQIESVKLIIQDNPEFVYALTDHRNTALNIASYFGHLAIVKFLLENGSLELVNFKNNSGYAPLNCAAEQGHLEIVRLLISKGVDLDSETKDGYTSLKLAINQNHSKIVQVLKNNGATLPINRLPILEYLQNQNELWFDIVKVRNDGFNAVLCHGNLGKTLVSVGTFETDQMVKFIIEMGGLNHSMREILKDKLVDLSIKEHLSGQCLMVRTIANFRNWRN